MALTSHRSKRKMTGGRYQSFRKKRVYEIRNRPVLTRIAALKLKVIRGVGGNVKRRLLAGDTVSVYNPKTKKHSQEKVVSVVENTANRHFVRRNIITKGAVVETAKGNVKITSRPGQIGALSGVLVK